MKTYYAPTEAVCSDARELENCVTAELIRVYLASEVDEEMRNLRETNRLLQLRDDYVTGCLV